MVQIAGFAFQCTYYCPPVIWLRRCLRSRRRVRKDQRKHLELPSRGPFLLWWSQYSDSGLPSRRTSCEIPGPLDLPSQRKRSHQGQHESPEWGAARATRRRVVDVFHQSHELLNQPRFHLRHHGLTCRRFYIVRRYRESSGPL